MASDAAPSRSPSLTAYGFRLAANAEGARACYVLAHGAGAGMHHAFMQAVAADLAERGIATLRYQFPYMEKGSRRPDTPSSRKQRYDGSGEAARLLPKVPLFAGGKSFGGRMTSQAQAASPYAGVVPELGAWERSQVKPVDKAA